jgi:hypothetical protein
MGRPSRSLPYWPRRHGTYGIKPIQWRLLTNRCATTLEESTELIDWYRCRWEVEIVVDELKNGCKVEALQLSNIERH